MIAPSPGSREPWISLLLPVYSVGSWLDECIASIVSQGLEGVEIICVDDASTAEDAQCLERWRARYPETIRVVTHARNRGVSAARNTLLEHATGGYLWFVDPDDLLEPGALPALHALVDAEAPDLVLCDFRTFSSHASSRRTGKKARGHVLTFEEPDGLTPGSRAQLVGGLFRSGQMHAWSKVVRRSAWPAELRFPEGRVFEDLAVFPRLALTVGHFVVTNQVWVAYRQRQGSLLASLTCARLEDWTIALVGFAAQVRAAALGPEVEFEVAHFTARTLLRAVRRLRKLQSSPGDDMTIRRYIERWRLSSPLKASELLSAYLAKGWFGRWFQLRWLLFRAGEGLH